MDQSKKTMRHFYCRDVLWETFEQMANDFDCSIDYLINEAMRAYARSKNYQAGQSSANMAAQPAGSLSATPANGAPAIRDRAPRKEATTPVPPMPSGESRSGSEARPGSSSGDGRPARPSIPPPPPSRTPSSPPPPPRPSVSEAPGAGPTLYLLFNNQRMSIDKDQFIIGRGSKTSDLAIKDGNISRKHAAVIRRNGMFYIKDLGSTNGIDYKGMRIDNKRIDEGDVFHICDYELKFTYR
jgi:hypothetical protein